MPSSRSKSFVSELEEIVDSDEAIDRIIEMWERMIEKNISQLRKELENCTPEEYWMLQGGILELNKLIDKQLRTLA